MVDAADFEDYSLRVPWLTCSVNYVVLIRSCLRLNVLPTGVDNFLVQVICINRLSIISTINLFS